MVFTVLVGVKIVFWSVEYIFIKWDVDFTFFVFVVL